MKKKIYHQLIACFKTRPQLDAFLAELNFVAHAIVKLGKQTSTMRKSIEPDTEGIEDLESSRLFALCAFTNRYSEEIKKISKGLKYTDEDVEKLFEMID